MGDENKELKIVSPIFLQKKAERIVAAIYLVTGILSDTEPIRYELRQTGISILSDIRYGFPVSNETIRRVRTDLSLLFSLLEIGIVSGMISTMNAQTLKQECLLLFEHLRSAESDGKGIIESAFLSDETAGALSEEERALFAVSDMPTSLGFTDKINQGFYKGHNKGHVTYKTHGISLKDNIKDENKKTSSKQSAGEKNEYRKKAILSVLEKNERLTIKDISASVKGVSEKTIQRDLAVLVREGVLTREGERRWTRYSIKKT